MHITTIVLSAARQKFACMGLHHQSFSDINKIRLIRTSIQFYCEIVVRVTAAKTRSPSAMTRSNKAGMSARGEAAAKKTMLHSRRFCCICKTASDATTTCIKAKMARPLAPEKGVPAFQYHAVEKCFVEKVFIRKRWGDDHIGLRFGTGRDCINRLDNCIRSRQLQS